MLSTRSALLATDWPYHRPLFNLTVKLTFKETLTLDQIMSLIETKWIHATFDTGQLKYPELRQYLTKWMGFFFWKSEQDFRLERHISEIHLKTQKDLGQLIDALVLKPFEEGLSPWRGILVQIENSSKNQTVALLSWHHCMWDGFSTINLFSELTSSDIQKRDYSNKMKDFERYRNQYYGTFCQKCLFLLRAPYEIILANVESYDPIQSNSWHLPQRELQRVWKTASGKKAIDIKLIKKVKAKFGVSFTSVLTAGITSATRNLMMKNPPRGVPEFINAGFPLPLPRHTKKLRNFWALTTLKLPVGEKDPVKRLFKIERRLQRLKRSTKPVMSILLLPLLGGLFPWMLKFIFSNRYTSMTISIMPGPSEEIKDSTGEITADGMEFYISLAQGNTALFEGGSYIITLRRSPCKEGYISACNYYRILKCVYIHTCALLGNLRTKLQR
ncbi:unnamed protein product [Allacma fusca]|uniref:O-acyltransferase WSD1 C-terminal domain-containing protein n=1 Tax=Allacma fusca TaxID=39272 RepID=A0A8J2NZW9_9HEXA|nr:unnamed protein product [Allacma fusca]